MSSSGTGNRTICFIRTDDAVPFVTEGVESNVFAAYMAALAETLGLGDESDASKLRHGCKTVMINETSCLESTPVFNEEEAPENIDDALRIHASAEYIRLIGEQCVDRASGYPACLSTNAAVDTSNETSNTNDDVNSAADNGVDETDESRSGAGGQLEEVTRSSSASQKIEVYPACSCLPTYSYSVAILSRRIVPDLRPSASQCTASVKGDSGDSTD